MHRLLKPCIYRKVLSNVVCSAIKSNFSDFFMEEWREKDQFAQSEGYERNYSESYKDCNILKHLGAAPLSIHDLSKVSKRGGVEDGDGLDSKYSSVKGFENVTEWQLKENVKKRKKMETRWKNVKSKGFDSPGPPYVEFPSTSARVQYMKGLQKQIQKDIGIFMFAVTKSPSHPCTFSAVFLGHQILITLTASPCLKSVTGLQKCLEIIWAKTDIFFTTLFPKPANSGCLEEKTNTGTKGSVHQDGKSQILGYDKSVYMMGTSSERSMCIYFSMGVHMLVEAGERKRDMGQIAENVNVKTRSSDHVVFPQDFFHKNSLITCHPTSAFQAALPCPLLPCPLLLHCHCTRHNFDHMCLGAAGGELEGGPWSPSLFAWGREPSIFSPEQWAVLCTSAINYLDEKSCLIVLLMICMTAIDNSISTRFTTSLLETLVNLYNLAPQDSEAWISSSSLTPRITEAVHKMTQCNCIGKGIILMYLAIRIFLAPSLKAHLSHEFFYQSAAALQKQFQLRHKQARQIVQGCASCQQNDQTSIQRHFSESQAHLGKAKFCSVCLKVLQRPSSTKIKRQFLFLWVDWNSYSGFNTAFTMIHTQASWKHEHHLMYQIKTRSLLLQVLFDRLNNLFKSPKLINQYRRGRCSLTYRGCGKPGQGTHHKEIVMFFTELLQDRNETVSAEYPINEDSQLTDKAENKERLGKKIKDGLTCQRRMLMQLTSKLIFQPSSHQQMRMTQWAKEYCTRFKGALLPPLPTAILIWTDFENYALQPLNYHWNSSKAGKAARVVAKGSLTSIPVMRQGGIWLPLLLLSDVLNELLCLNLLSLKLSSHQHQPESGKAYQRVWMFSDLNLVAQANTQNSNDRKTRKNKIKSLSRHTLMKEGTQIQVQLKKKENESSSQEKPSVRPRIVTSLSYTQVRREKVMHLFHNIQKFKNTFKKKFSGVVLADYFCKINAKDNIKLDDLLRRKTRRNSRQREFKHIQRQKNASQKDHDRNLPTGMSLPERQNPVAGRLGLWGMAPEWPAMNTGSKGGQHCLGTRVHDSPRTWEGICPSLLCTPDHTVNTTLHAEKTSTSWLEARGSTKASKWDSTNDLASPKVHKKMWYDQTDKHLVSHQYLYVHQTPKSLTYPPVSSGVMCPSPCDPSPLSRAFCQGHQCICVLEHSKLHKKKITGMSQETRCRSYALLILAEKFKGIVSNNTLVSRGKMKQRFAFLSQKQMERGNMTKFKSTNKTESQYGPIKWRGKNAECTKPQQLSCCQATIGKKKKKKERESGERTRKEKKADCGDKKDILRPFYLNAVAIDTAAAQHYEMAEKETEHSNQESLHRGRQTTKHTQYAPKCLPRCCSEGLLGLRAFEFDSQHEVTGNEYEMQAIVRKEEKSLSLRSPIECTQSIFKERKMTCYFNILHSPHSTRMTDKFGKPTLSPFSSKRVQQEQQIEALQHQEKLPGFLRRNNLGKQAYLVEEWSPQFEVICKKDRHVFHLLLSITERDKTEEVPGQTLFASKQCKTISMTIQNTWKGEAAENSKMQVIPGSLRISKSQPSLEHFLRNCNGIRGMQRYLNFTAHSKDDYIKFMNKDHFVDHSKYYKKHDELNVFHAKGTTKKAKFCIQLHIPKKMEIDIFSSWNILLRHKGKNFTEKVKVFCAVRNIAYGLTCEESKAELGHHAANRAHGHFLQGNFMATEDLWVLYPSDFKNFNMDSNDEGSEIFLYLKEKLQVPIMAMQSGEIKYKPENTVCLHMPVCTYTSKVPRSEHFHIPEHKDTMTEHQTTLIQSYSSKSFGKYSIVQIKRKPYRIMKNLKHGYKNKICLMIPLMDVLGQDQTILLDDPLHSCTSLELEAKAISEEEFIGVRRDYRGLAETDKTSTIRQFYSKLLLMEAFRSSYYNMVSFSKSEIKAGQWQIDESAKKKNLPVKHIRGCKLHPRETH
ncbi:hypothetical protein DV515_00005303 [Chloebia gouldiae]|uniref:Integrase-type domain-containing protein n=1 Tax=Chloebia gouldiae TaxID=44316 RepID=A0A3L8SPA6_CHLGU|nr:hypothetical protein DV515_00005303 [Chloebia gouldiae]